MSPLSASVSLGFRNWWSCRRDSATGPWNRGRTAREKRAVLTKTECGWCHTPPIADSVCLGTADGCAEQDTGFLSRAAETLLDARSSQCPFEDISRAGVAGTLHECGFHELRPRSAGTATPSRQCACPRTPSTAVRIPSRTVGLRKNAAGRRSLPRMRRNSSGDSRTTEPCNLSCRVSAAHGIS
jgi:hypothetical protein